MEERQRRGAPQELIPPRNVGDGLATFVWRGDDSTTGVTLDATLPSRPEPRALKRLPGTDVWYWSERLPLDSRFSYDFQVTRRTAAGEKTEEVPDPLNPRLFLGDSVGEMYSAPRQPWISPMPGVRKGTITHVRLFSKSVLDYRELTIYVPAGFKAPKVHGCVVASDGQDYLDQTSAATTLDNLIGLGRIPPLIGVFVSSASKIPGEMRTRDLSCGEDYARFLAKEVIPFVSHRFGVSLRPEQCVITGVSLGGLQAAFTAFRYPRTFGRALCQSGSFFYYRNWPTIESSVSTQTGWLTTQYATAPRRPIKLWIETGTFEGDGVHEVRRFRDVAIAKGYSVSYYEFNGGHNRLSWRGSFADALIALIGTAVSSKASH